jgi:hypothetical protein
VLPTGGRGRRFAALPQLLERAPGQDQLQDGSTARQPGFQQMPAFQNGLAAAATLARGFEQIAQVTQTRIGGGLDLDGAVAKRLAGVRQQRDGIGHDGQRVQ